MRKAGAVAWRPNACGLWINTPDIRSCSLQLPATRERILTRRRGGAGGRGPRQGVLPPSFKDGRSRVLHRPVGSGEVAGDAGMEPENIVAAQRRRAAENLDPDD